MGSEDGEPGGVVWGSEDGELGRVEELELHPIGMLET